MIAEPGSGTAGRAWNAADGLAAGRILYPEARAALAAAQRARRLSAAALVGRKKEVEQLWSQIDVVELTPRLGQSAGEVAEHHGLRGYDAVHLASALVISADVIVSADAELLAAAMASGLAVIDCRS